MADQKPLVLKDAQPQDMPAGDAVPMACGGTGAVTAQAARENLGAISLAEARNIMTYRA